MKTKMTLACFLAAFAVVAMTYSPARAQYMYQQGSTPPTLNVQGTAPIAVTIYYVREGAIADVQLLVSPRGDFFIPRRATRVVFEANAPRGSTGLFTLTQGGQLLAEESLGGQLPHSVRVVGDFTW